MDSRIVGIPIPITSRYAYHKAIVGDTRAVVVHCASSVSAGPAASSALPGVRRVPMSVVGDRIVLAIETVSVSARRGKHQFECVAEFDSTAREVLELIFDRRYVRNTGSYPGPRPGRRGPGSILSSSARRTGTHRIQQERSAT